MKPYILTLAAAGALMLTSCIDNNYMELDKGSDELTLKSDVTEIVLKEINYSATAINLEWSTGHNFKTGNKIYYTLEIAPSGSDFSGSYIAVDNQTQIYQWSKTVEELNDIIRNNFSKASQSYQARIRASVPDCDEVQESIIEFSASTYEPVTKTLYIIGDAAPNGWSADNAAEMTRTSNGVFTWQGNMREGNFKFITTLGQFLPSYNKGTDGKLVFRDSDDDPDEQFHIDEAYTYKVDVNLLTGAISWGKSEAETPAYDNLYLVGNMTGWSFEAMQKDLLDPFLFRMGKYFDQGGEFKFGTVNGSWENMLKATSPNASITDASMQFISGFDPDDKWFMKDEEAGKAYKICVDIRKGKERMMMREFVPYECIYMIGSACSAGWDLSNAVPMNVDASNPYILTWEGGLNAGELKFTCDKKSDWNGAWFLADKGDKNPTGEQERLLFVDKSDEWFKSQYLEIGIGDIDQKWQIPSAGTYSITLDQLNETISIVKK